MEYALRHPAPVVAKEALIRAFRDGDKPEKSQQSMTRAR